MSGCPKEGERNQLEGEAHAELADAGARRAIDVLPGDLAKRGLLRARPWIREKAAPRKKRLSR
jgi:hypothetical protein